jgi:hypothetical protein
MAINEGANGVKKKGEAARTRPPEAPLDENVARSYLEVQPPGFGENPRSSIEAAVVDPDVDDTEGGE